MQQLWNSLTSLLAPVWMWKANRCVTEAKRNELTRAAAAFSGNPVPATGRTAVDADDIDWSQSSTQMYPFLGFWTMKSNGSSLLIRFSLDEEKGDKANVCSVEHLLWWHESIQLLGFYWAFVIEAQFATLRPFLPIFFRIFSFLVLLPGPHP